MGSGTERVKSVHGVSESWKIRIKKDLRAEIRDSTEIFGNRHFRKISVDFGNFGRLRNFGRSKISVVLMCKFADFH